MKLRDKVPLNVLFSKARATKVKIELERRNIEASQAATIRLIDDRHRHRHATRSTTVAYRIVASASFFERVLNVQQDNDPLVASARTA